MSYAVKITRTAIKQFRKLAPPYQGNIAIAIISLGNKPSPVAARKLANSSNDWRIRVGDYRVLYEIDEVERQVTIWRIAHRREAYH